MELFPGDFVARFGPFVCRFGVETYAEESWGTVGVGRDVETLERYRFDFPGGDGGAVEFSGLDRLAVDLEVEADFVCVEVGEEIFVLDVDRCEVVGGDFGGLVDLFDFPEFCRDLSVGEDDSVVTEWAVIGGVIVVSAICVVPGASRPHSFVVWGWFS